MRHGPDRTMALLAEARRRSQARNPDRPSRWCPHVPFAKQQLFLDLTCTEALYAGSAGSAKSDALLMAALQYVDEPGYAAILFRRTYADLSKPGALMDRAHDWLSGTAAKWNDRDKVWRFPSGATLSFGYLDGPRDHFNYQGGQYQFIGFDEQSQLRPSQTRYLASRIRRLQGSTIPMRIRGATNPGDIGHDYLGDRFNIPELPGDDIVWSRDEGGEPIACVRARLEDNPHIDLAEYDRMLSKLDPITRRQLREGHWVKDASKLVYSGFSTSRNVVDRLPDPPGDEPWIYVLAMDFGMVDPTAFCVLAFNRHSPNVYVVESEQWTNMHPSEAAEMVKAWSKRYGGFERLIGDVSGLGKAYEGEMRIRFYLPVTAAQKPNKLGFIKLMNGDLHAGRLLLVRGANPQLIEDMAALQWHDDRGTKEREDMANHLTDAALYGWRECRHWAWTDAEEKPEPDSPKANEAEARELYEAHRRAVLERQRRKPFGR